MIVFFICPRPVVIVSVVHGDEGNVFPMNLMGPIGNGRFAFSLNSTRHAAPITGRAGKLASAACRLRWPLWRANWAKTITRTRSI